jgi:hypothetical protein
VVVEWEQDRMRGLPVLMPVVCAQFDNARSISIQKVS